MIIVGALGFAKELLEALRERPMGELSFFDDVTKSPQGCIFENYSVIRDFELCKEYFRRDKRFILGVGSPSVRFSLSEKFEAVGGNLTGIVSAKASIGTYNHIHESVTILQNVIVENDNKIGKGVLLHVGTFISHDVEVGDFTEISPFAKLLGRVKIGGFCSIGTGAIILPGVRLGNHVTVGAGAVVTKDVADNLTVVGIPAKVR